MVYSCNSRKMDKYKPQILFCFLKAMHEISVDNSTFDIIKNKLNIIFSQSQIKNADGTIFFKFDTAIKIHFSVFA